MEDKMKIDDMIDKIYNEDCLKTMERIPNNSVDLVLTDPPYGIEYHSNYYKDENPHDKIKNDDSLYTHIDKYWNMLKNDGAIFIFYSYKDMLIDERIKNRIIWVKNNWTAGDLKGNFGNQYESIAFIPKKNFKLKGKRYTNVWNFDRVPPDDLLHPTEKPLDLIERIVKVSTNEGDVVYDPFIGSGTTAVACEKLDRRWFGSEISEEHYETAREKVKTTERKYSKSFMDFADGDD